MLQLEIIGGISALNIWNTLNNFRSWNLLR